MPKADPVSDKWWVDPTFDPMQDLHDCKLAIAHQREIMLEHSKQLNDLNEIIKFQGFEIACLAKIIKDNVLDS